MISLDEILNIRPSRWKNLTIKEFERDIKLLQDEVKKYKEIFAKWDRD